MIKLHFCTEACLSSSVISSLTTESVNWLFVLIAVSPSYWKQLGEQTLGGMLVGETNPFFKAVSELATVEGATVSTSMGLESLWLKSEF